MIINIQIKMCACSLGTYWFDSLVLMVPTIFLSFQIRMTDSFFSIADIIKEESESEEDIMTEVHLAHYSPCQKLIK